MKKEDIEQYIKVLTVDPNSKYILFISRLSGLRKAEVAQLKLNENFIDEILLVDGNVNDVVVSIPITK